MRDDASEEEKDVQEEEEGEDDGMYEWEVCLSGTPVLKRGWCRSRSCGAEDARCKMEMRVA